MIDETEIIFKIKDTLANFKLNIYICRDVRINKYSFGKDGLAAHTRYYSKQHSVPKMTGLVYGYWRWNQNYFWFGIDAMLTFKSEDQELTTRPKGQFIYFCNTRY